MDEPPTDAVEQVWTFEWTPGTIHVVAAAGALLLAAVLMAVGNSIVWGGVEADGVRIDLSLSEARVVVPGFPVFGQDWSSEQFDDADGIGAVRIGSTLWLVGLITAFVATAVVAVAIVIRHAQVAALGSIMASIGALLALAALIVFPIGAEQAWDWFADEGSQQTGASFPRDIGWGGGLGVAIAAVVLILAGTVLGFTATRHDDIS